jgi:hypothetical protein
MNINELTIGEAKELANLFNNKASSNDGLNSLIGEKVIIRTYSAGVHFGTLIEKSGTEVILKDSRRLWYWKAIKSISLSAVAKYGLSDKSKVAPEVEKQWLDAIEIIPCTKEAIKSIEGQKDVEAS